jgi:hypothetical protein
MGIARLDLNVGQTALLAAFLDTGLVCSAYVAIQAVQFLSNSFEKASFSHICNNVHNAEWPLTLASLQPFSCGSQTMGRRLGLLLFRQAVCC